MRKANRIRSFSIKTILVVIVAIAGYVLALLFKVCPENIVFCPNKIVNLCQLQRGDFYNWANAIFTGLALVGVIVAASMQYRTIRLQREEITVEKKKGFEDSYFLLLDRLIKLRDDFYFRLNKTKDKDGRKAFKKAYDTFINYVTKTNEHADYIDAEEDEKYGDYIRRKQYGGEELNKLKKENHVPLINNEPATTLDDYLKSSLFVFYHSSLSGYSEELILICEKVESVESLDEKEKSYYLKFLGNQITRIECCVLFYYSLSLAMIDHNNKLLDYLLKYSLLEHLDGEDFVKGTDHEKKWNSFKDLLKTADVPKKYKGQDFPYAEYLKTIFNGSATNADE